MPRKTWRAALAAYASPSTLVLLLLGFAAGLPYMLVFSTLSVWLREAGVARETIGYAEPDRPGLCLQVGLVAAARPMAPAACWASSDAAAPGWCCPRSLVILGLIGMGFCDPQKHLSWLIAIAVVVAFASATQDIAVDAYRLEIADDSRQAALAASYMSGYRIAALLATAGALFFAEGFGSTGFNYQALGLDRHLSAVRLVDGARPADHPVHARATRAAAHPAAGRDATVSVINWCRCSC